MSQEHTSEPKGEDNENDKVYTDIKKGWDKRPEAYPATKGVGDNIDTPPGARGD